MHIKRNDAPSLIHERPVDAMVENPISFKEYDMARNRNEQKRKPVRSLKEKRQEKREKNKKNGVSGRKGDA